MHRDADSLVKPLTTPPVELPPSPEPIGPLGSTTRPTRGTTRGVVTLLAAALMLASACTEVPNGDEAPVPVDPTVTTPVDPVDPTTGDEPQVDPKTVTDPMVVEPAIPPTDASVSVCLPTAAAYPEENVPQLPRDVIPALCGGEPIDAEPIPEQAEESTVYSWDPAERVLVVDSSGGVFETTTTFWLDSQQRVRQIVAEGRGGFYIQEDGATTYRFDEDGNLVYKRATRTDTFLDPVEPMEDLEKRQTWENGLITSRIERDLLADRTLVEIRWTRDETGRLIEAEAIAPGHDEIETRTTRAVWTYDEAGRPASVTRTWNGVEVVAETWTWDEDGHLAARTASKVGREMLIAEHGGEHPHWMPVASLDDMEWVSTDFVVRDPWQQASLGLTGTDRAELAGSETTAEGCRNLSRGVAHGYPSSEGLYALGVEPELRPNGIGFAHGYDGFAWNYGDDAWFGHLGVASPWPGAYIEEDSSYLSELTFDRGFLTTEVVHAEWVDGETESFSRSRTLDGSSLTDTVVVGAFTDDLTYLTLAMELDEGGRVVAREQRIDEQPVAAQSWERDAEGRVLAYHIEHLGEVESNLSSRIFGTQPTVLPQDNFASLHLEWTAEGRMASRWVAGGTMDSTPETRTYDEAGRLVAVENAIDGQAAYRTWTFRADGQLATACETWDSTEPVCMRHVYDDLGREIAVWRERADGEAWLTRAVAYDCAAD